MLKKINVSKLFFAIVVIAFVAKLIAGFNVRNTFMNRGNSHTPMNALAFNLIGSNEFSITSGTPSIDYEPLYPWLMSIGYRISGSNWLGVTVLQAVLHALTSLMLFLSARTLWNELAGFFAGLFHVMYPYLFLYTISIYDTTLFVFLVVAVFYLLTQKNLTTKHLLLGGIALGLGFLTRGTMIVFIPALLWYVFYNVMKEKNVRTAIIGCGIVITATALTMAPWLIRNKNLTGRLMISTHGPFGLWQGNNDFTKEYLSNNISLDEIYKRVPPPDIYAKYPNKERAPIEAIAVADAYKIEASTWIKNHPSEFIELAFIKAQKLWTWNRNPASKPKFGTNEDRDTANIISYLPLLLLSIAGIFFVWKKNIPLALLFIGTAICYTGAHMIAMGFTRARLPLDPLLMILAGIALDKIVSRMQLSVGKKS